MSNLVKKVQTHHHTTRTRIVRSEEKINEIIVKQSKKLIEKVCSYMVTISDLSGVKLSKILEESAVTAD